MTKLFIGTQPFPANMPASEEKEHWNTSSAHDVLTHGARVPDEHAANRGLPVTSPFV
jgi:hypothetical protein